MPQEDHVEHHQRHDAERQRCQERRIIVVSPLDIAEEGHLGHIKVPALTPAQQPILESLVMQTLAVETAIARGYDPDAFVFHHNDTKVA